MILKLELQLSLEIRELKRARGGLHAAGKVPLLNLGDFYKIYSLGENSKSYILLFVLIISELYIYT